MKKRDYVQTKYSLDLNKKQNRSSFFKGVCVVETIIILVLSFMCYYIYNFIQERAYVIEVNTLTGVSKLKNNSVVPLKEYQPSVDIIMNDLRFFIEALRTVTADDSIQKAYIEKVYSKATKNALSYVNDYYEKNPPLTLSRTEKREISVYNIHRISDSTYEFLFNERIFDRTDSNKLIKETNNKATLHIRLFSPSSDRDRELNPLGLFIDDISFSVIKNGIATDYDLEKR